MGDRLAVKDCERVVRAKRWRDLELELQRLLRVALAQNLLLDGLDMTARSQPQDAIQLLTINTDIFGFTYIQGELKWR